MTELSKPSILLIDDTLEVLGGLEEALRMELHDETVEIVTWCPSIQDGADVRAKFESLVNQRTVLVATDYDLTKGMKGLFGLTVVGWCQQNSIPVGDFSRNTVKALPKEPNLFEFRIPAHDQEAAHYIASVFRGFQELRKRLDEDATISTKRSLAAVLAAVLARPQNESQFSLYMSRLGAANSSLLEKLKEFVGTPEPSSDEKKRLLAYVLGHVLFNAILKYPGPILSEKALCAYVATSDEEAAAITEIFENALYTGPFDRSACYFWRDEVDKIIDKLGENLNDEDFEMFSDFNRRAVELKLSRELKNHDCYRCEGTKGGFLCPFTQRPVCLRADCSVAASSWIPQGAQLCRVEKDFYDEWAPLLGF
jgi:hypothetical protein